VPLFVTFPFTVIILPLSANVLFALIVRFPFINTGVAAGSVFTEAAPAPNERLPKLAGKDENVKVPVPLRFTELAAFNAYVMLVGKQVLVVLVEVKVVPEPRVKVLPATPVIWNVASANVTVPETVRSPFTVVADPRVFTPFVARIKFP
jgi:hypothetical protein